jgi:phosphopantothenoylcysteine decarboxylase/phosphopantothenate--cysteine ligase
MAAAPADFRPVDVAVHKIKKSDDGDAPTVKLVQNPDVLAELSAERLRAGQVVVGFAAETGDASGSVLDHGQRKLARKGCDLLVVNDVGEGRGFEVAQNSAVVLDASGTVTDVPLGPKEDLADVIWDLVVQKLE